MYKTGEFAEMTELSKETLRYYADIKLLVPVYVDPNSGYKYYDNNSFLTARLLFYLRKFDFSIQEMKQVIHERSLDELEQILLEKKEKLKQKIQEIQDLIDEIDGFIDYGNGVEKDDSVE
jgi:DNA-binding transcriptional MerR regulator